MNNFGATLCMIPQKLKNKMKIGDRNRYQEIYRMNCLTGFRNLVGIWLMKVLPKGVDAEECTHLQFVS